MASKHTPGPWSYDTLDWPYVINGAADEIVAQIPEQAGRDEVALADAKLMAMAPRLAEIVRNVLAVCNEGDHNTLMHTLYREVQQRGATVLAEIDS